VSCTAKTKAASSRRFELDPFSSRPYSTTFFPPLFRFPFPFLVRSDLRCDFAPQGCNLTRLIYLSLCPSSFPARYLLISLDIHLFRLTPLLPSTTLSLSCQRGLCEPIMKRDPRHDSCLRCASDCIFLALLLFVFLLFRFSKFQKKKSCYLKYGSRAMQCK